MDNNNFGYFLLPYKFKLAGYVLLLPAFILVYLRFFLGIKLSFLQLPAFAVYSSYLEVKTFSLIQNNYTEELTALILLIGLIFVSFSKEKVEYEELNKIRLKALILSFYINSVLIIISLFVVFGFGYVTVMMINIFSIFIIYLINFRILMLRKIFKNLNIEEQINN